MKSLPWLLVLAALPAVGSTVLVYGGTPAGVAAAVTAAEMGDTVTLVEPTQHVGGVIAGGLTRTDIGDPTTVGGFPRRFFDRCRDYYAATYGADSAQVKDSKGGMYMEPHVAEEQFDALLAGAKVTVLKGLHIVAATHGEKAALTAIAVVDEAGAERALSADAVVDASNEGDLMAAAHVPYRVGREPRREYDEPHAGITAGGPGLVGEGDHKIQAYNFRLCLTTRDDLKVLPTQPAHYDRTRYLRLLAGLKTVQPPGLHPFVLNLWPVANGKIDANNGHGWQSTDLIRMSWGYPEAGWAERQRLAQVHLEYAQGLLYFIQNDPEVPEAYRTEARKYGLARDEFTDHGNWPTQLYIREARRMIGVTVFTERDATTNRAKPDSIGLGSYPIDIHGIDAWPHPDRGVTYEGGVSVHGIRPYEIPYGVLCPPNVPNLLVPVCCSATHVGYGTLRMEPVYMILGQAAGAAAHQALAAGVPVRDLPVAPLQAALREQHAILDAPVQPEAAIECAPSDQVAVGAEVTFAAVPANARTQLADAWWDFDGDGKPDAQGLQAKHTFDRDQRATVWLVAKDANAGWTPFARAVVTVGQGGPAEVLVDDDTPEANRSHGEWSISHAIAGYVGINYRHHDPATQGAGAWRFMPTVPAEGRYRVLLGTVPQGNRATNVAVTVHHADGDAAVTVDQRADRGPFPFADLGVYRFTAGGDGNVLVRADGADGIVVADSLRLVPQP